MEKVKSAYATWFIQYQILPKSHRHSLGLKIDGVFIELIEVISAAWFLAQKEKQPLVRRAIQKNDTLKILLMILWEMKTLDTKKYTLVSTPIDELGKMLGGWHGQLVKQNSAGKPTEK